MYIHVYILYTLTSATDEKLSCPDSQSFSIILPISDWQNVPMYQLTL